MKKLMMVSLVLAFLAGHCYAGTSLRTVLEDEKMTTANTYTEVDFSAESAKRVAFFITCDSSYATSGVTLEVSPQFSIDGTNWVAGYFYDHAGGTTLQASDDLHLPYGDGSYLMWLEEAVPFKYIRMGIGLDGTAEGELGVGEYNSVTITLIEDK